MKKIKLLFALFLIIAVPLFSQPSRKALVIGNSNYKYVNILRNPKNDVDKISKLLKELNFDVTSLLDLDLEKFEDEIRLFTSSIKPKDIILIYFSGHGVQVKGENYLIPVDAKITEESDIRYKSVNAGFILEKLENSKSDFNLIILDACRYNPFKGFKATSEGLAAINSPSGTLIAYATAPGKVAFDGSGENSPFTKWLLNIIPKYGLKVEEVFKEVRRNVIKETNNEQVPWESSSLVGDFYFVEKAVNSTVTDNKFKFSSKTTGYVNSSLNAYMSFESPTTEVVKDSKIEIGYELFDNNLIDKITPLFVDISQRIRPTMSNLMFREQYTINPGKNKITLFIDFEPGEYTLSLGFYFLNNVDQEFPTFYNKKIPLRVVNKN